MQNITRRYATLLLFLLCLSGCASPLGNIKYMQGNKKITLPEIYATSSIMNDGKTQYVEGLTAGVYTEEAENEEGTFFRGPKDCVILLVGKPAEFYLQSNKLPTHDFKVSNQGGFFGEEGGIWIPKPGVNKKPRYYYYFDPKNYSNFGPVANALVDIDRGKIQIGPNVNNDSILKAFN